MTRIKTHFWEIALILFLFVLGFYMRVEGIGSNQSFWADEGFVGLVSKRIVMGKQSFIAGINLVGYQRLQVISNVVSFKIFGISEWSARLMSVVWGSVGIIFAYLLAKKLSNKWGGLLSAFIYAIFQLNLAYATQAKPYAAIETIFLIVLYLTTLLAENSKKIHLHILIITFSTFATLYNYIGAITFIPYLFIVIPFVYKNLKLSKKYLLLAVPIFLFLIWWLRIYQFIPTLINPKYNWITLVRELFWRQYGLYTLPALFGFFMIKDKRSKVGIGSAILALLYAWTFVAYSHNIRYLMPIFGLIVVLFGVFWSEVGNLIFKKPTLICLLVALLVYSGGYKVVRKPAAYYTPNADFTSDVQNADYKTFFQKIHQLFPDFDHLPVFVGPFDTLSWYTDRNPTALFSINTPKPVYVDVVQSWQYGTLAEFKNEQTKYSKGLVVVNDWQSFMPDDIKDYVKKNMKLELRVESMTVSPYDKWPLELYSWGMDRKTK